MDDQKYYRRNQANHNSVRLSFFVWYNILLSAEEDTSRSRVEEAEEANIKIKTKGTL